MENTVNTANTSVPLVSLGQQRKASLPIKKASAESVPLPKPSRSEGAIDQTLANAEAKRFERLEQAANSFAVSDLRFTMYKDASGQLITRFTSLIDGKVTYLPEPNVLASLGQFQSTQDSTLSLKI